MGVLGLASCQSMQMLCGARGFLVIAEELRLFELRMGRAYGRRKRVGLDARLRLRRGDFAPSLAGARTSLKLQSWAVPKWTECRTMRKRRPPPRS
eukprot:s3041_g19.t1